MIETDIKLNPIFQKMLSQQIEPTRDKQQTGFKRKIFQYMLNQWPNATVPYVFSSKFGKGNSVKSFLNYLPIKLDFHFWENINQIFWITFCARWKDNREWYIIKWKMNWKIMESEDGKWRRKESPPGRLSGIFKEEVFVFLSDKISLFFAIFRMAKRGGTSYRNNRIRFVYSIY